MYHKENQWGQKDYLIEVGNRRGKGMCVNGKAEQKRTAQRKGGKEKTGGKQWEQNIVTPMYKKAKAWQI